MKSEHINPFLEATINVISTMAMLQPKAGKPYLKKDKKAIGDISGVIGLTGDKRGAIVLTFSSGAACKIVGSMLGEEYTDLNKDVEDAVGELTNQVSGDARRRLSALGLTLEAGLPSIVVGAEHQVVTMCKGPIIVIPFKVEGLDFVVEASFD